jgi:hypothetical protein
MEDNSAVVTVSNEESERIPQEMQKLHHGGHVRKQLEFGLIQRAS